MHQHRLILLQVDWKSEKNCFATVFREIARFYIPTSPLDMEYVDGPTHADSTADDKRMEAIKAASLQNKQVLFPAIQKYLVAPKRLLERDVAQIANLPDLYRVFERC